MYDARERVTLRVSVAAARAALALAQVVVHVQVARQVAAAGLRQVPAAGGGADA